ncbi:hypothetical protein FRC01_008733, partial [Tulasnella sp. 417]
KRRDSIKSGGAGKAGSTKSGPQTPALSDVNGTPKISFDKKLGGHEVQTPLSHPPPPLLTPVSPGPSSTPPLRAVKSPTPQRPPPPSFDHSLPPLIPRDSVEQGLNSLRPRSMKQNGGDRSTTVEPGQSESRPQTPVLSDFGPALETSLDEQFEPPTTHIPLSNPPMITSGFASPLPSNPSTDVVKRPISQGLPRKEVPSPPMHLPAVSGTSVQRSQPLHPQNSTPGVDPRSSMYQAIHSTIDFSDPDMLDLNLLGGLYHEHIPAAEERDVFNPGDDAEGPQESDREGNETETVGARAKSGHGSSRSFSALTRTLSGALSIFGAGSVGDTYFRLPKKHRRRTSHSPSNIVNQPEEVVETEEKRLEDLREETTVDGLGDDEDRVVAAGGKETPTDPLVQACPPDPTRLNFPLSPIYPISPPLSAFRTETQSFSLNSPPLSPVSSPIRFPSPTITMTAPEDFSRSTKPPVPPAPPSPARAISSILLPRRKSLSARQASQSNGSTAEATTGSTSPNADELDTSYSTSLPSLQGHPKPAPLPSPHPSSVQLQPPATPPSPKVRSPTRSLAGRMRLKWTRKKDSGSVDNDEPIVKSLDEELPRYALYNLEDVLIYTTSSRTAGTGRRLIVPPASSKDDIPFEGHQLPSQVTTPPGPKPTSLLILESDDKTLDLYNQQSERLVRGFHSEPLKRSNTGSERLSSKLTSPPRLSLNTTRASLASSNRSDLTPSVDEDTSSWAPPTRADPAFPPPSPQPPAIPPFTPGRHTQSLHDKTLRRSKNIPWPDAATGRSPRTGNETPSSTVWSDKEDSPVATTKNSPVPDTRSWPGPEEGSTDGHHERYEHYLCPPIQHPRMPGLHYRPASTDLKLETTLVRIP